MAGGGALAKDGWGSGARGQGSGDGGNALVITAKYPYPGAVKTRLASRLGFGLATGLYRAFLRDLDAAFPAAHWAYTPKDSPFPDFLGAGRRYLVQEGDDLGERMFNLFRSLFARGFARVVLVGSDIPHLSPVLVERAFEALGKRDVVLGPAADGGYYLIGMRDSHDLFANVDWSTPHVLTQTLAKAADQGLSVALLPQTFDVDDSEDLRQLMALLESQGNGVSGYAADERIAGPFPSGYPLPQSADTVFRSPMLDGLLNKHEVREVRTSLSHTSAILRTVGRADATLGQSKIGWYYRLTPAQAEKEEQACLRIVRTDELGRQLKRHMALVAGVAGVLVERLREDLGLPLSDIAVITARYHDIYRSGDRSHRLIPYGVGPKGLFFPHDGHEARLAFALRKVEAGTMARVVRRHNVLRPLYPEARTIDDNVLLIADAMVEAGEVVPIHVRREAIITRYAATDPQGARAYHAAYDVVERTLGLYFDAGLDRSRFRRELGLL